MRILPVGIESRLLLAQRALLFTPRIWRFGIAQSLLVARLRYRRGALFLPMLPGQVEQPRIEFVPLRLPEVAEIKPLDLLWPSEIEEDELIIVVEERGDDPPPMPGSILDILS